jgi:hypothetical protein
MTKTEQLIKKIICYVKENPESLADNINTAYNVKIEDKFIKIMADIDYSGYINELYISKEQQTMLDDVFRQILKDRRDKEQDKEVDKLLKLFN